MRPCKEEHSSRGRLLYLRPPRSAQFGGLFSQTPARAAGAYMSPTLLLALASSFASLACAWSDAADVEAAALGYASSGHQRHHHPHTSHLKRADTNANGRHRKRTRWMDHHASIASRRRAVLLETGDGGARHAGLVRTSGEKHAKAPLLNDMAVRVAERVVAALQPILHVDGAAERERRGSRAARLEERAELLLAHEEAELRQLEASTVALREQASRLQDAIDVSSVEGHVAAASPQRGAGDVADSRQQHHVLRREVFRSELRLPPTGGVGPASFGEVATPPPSSSSYKEPKPRAPDIFGDTATFEPVARTVWCGGHAAFSCFGCAQQGGEPFCNGDCEWKGECTFRADLVWCGAHSSDSCGMCTKSGLEDMGYSWCNGDCVWQKVGNGSPACVLKPKAAESGWAKEGPEAGAHRDTHDAESMLEKDRGESSTRAATSDSGASLKIASVVESHPWYPWSKAQLEATASSARFTLATTTPVPRVTAMRPSDTTAVLAEGSVVSGDTTLSTTLGSPVRAAWPPLRSGQTE